MEKGNEVMSFRRKSDINSAIDEIERLLNSGIFTKEGSKTPFFKASFIHVMILLRELMYNSEKYANKRIDFKDDVIPLKMDKKKQSVHDITDLIKYVRDSMCHTDIPHHYFTNEIKATFNVVFGRGVLISYGEDSVGSDYEDDICFFFGKERIYLNRHIIRAFVEARAALLPLTAFPTWDSENPTY